MIPEMDDDSNEVDGSDVEPDYEYQPSGSGNRNYKGKASRNGHGNSGGYEKNENTGKPGVSNSVKKVDVVFPVANMGRSSQLKSGMNGKQSTVDKTYSASRVSGSRFEILNTEDDGMIIEGDVLAKEVASGSKNIK
ncbi:hypothetical protein LWI29_031351 [Acer saccharum]|uniref:Uncharacterized protein n=1 Tax=Acer saccharum TaxID=4024 RepID=A0AA39UXA9_ACESA|nr:hypothetical protein LWI29_031351 [Acer saccharum]